VEIKPILLISELSSTSVANPQLLVSANSGTPARSTIGSSWNWTRNGSKVRYTIELLVEDVRVSCIISNIQTV
jgi:hypothetical protein